MNKILKITLKILCFPAILFFSLLTLYALVSLLGSVADGSVVTNPLESVGFFAGNILFGWLFVWLIIKMVRFIKK